MTPEGRIKKKFKDRLKPLIDSGKVWCVMPVQSRFGGRMLDFVVCARGSFILVEAKKDADTKLRAYQEHTRGCVQKAGGFVMVIYDDRSIDYAIDEIAIRAGFRP